MDSNRRIIELLQILASEPKPSPSFELQEDTFEQQQQLKHAALRSLAQHRINPAIWQMFASLNRELPDGNRDQILFAAQQLAAILLPAFQRADLKAVRETQHQTFLRAASKFDPFLEGGTSLTRDSFAGLGDVEPDTWADGINLERRR